MKGFLGPTSTADSGSPSSSGNNSIAHYYAARTTQHNTLNAITQPITAGHTNTRQQHEPGLPSAALPAARCPLPSIPAAASPSQIRPKCPAAALQLRFGRGVPAAVRLAPWRTLDPVTAVFHLRQVSTHGTQGTAASQPTAGPPAGPFALPLPPACTRQATSRRCSRTRGLVRPSHAVPSSPLPPLDSNCPGGTAHSAPLAPFGPSPLSASLPVSTLSHPHPPWPTEHSKALLKYRPSDRGWTSRSAANGAHQLGIGNTTPAGLGAACATRLPRRQATAGYTIHTVPRDHVYHTRNGIITKVL